MRTIKYSVWCGGIEINDYYSNKQQAVDLHNKYLIKGYDDVVIQEQYFNF